MPSRSRKLLSTLAVFCAASGLASAVPESCARTVLQTAERAASRLTSCAHTAADMVGETILKLIQRRRDVVQSPAKSAQQFVRVSVANTYRDHLRKQNRVHCATDLQDQEPQHEIEIVDTSSDARQLARIVEFRSSLSPKDSEVLSLLEQGHGDRDIAKLLGRTRYDVRLSIEQLRKTAGRYLEATEQMI